MFFSRVIIQGLSVLATVFLLTGCARVTVCRSDIAPIKQLNVPILLYHHIAILPADAGKAQRVWTISPKEFDEQMRWITERGFHPVTMAQLTAHLHGGSPLPVKPIVISFDDGWKDQYLSAVPILKKYNFSATFFIITGSVGCSAYMNWDQVLELSDAGMDIEAHSRAHSRLAVLPSEEAWREIDDSKKALEGRLRKPVTVFSYPFGSYDDKVISLIKEAGFEMAVTVSGLNGGYLVRADQSYALFRYAVKGMDKDKLDNNSVSQFLGKFN